MHFPRSLPSGAICALLFVLASQATHPTRYVSGVVLTTEDAPVAQTTVSIDGDGSTVTTDSGNFALPLAPPLKVGHAATFHVDGWVIVDPCVFARGRVYLPDPDAEPIAIRVLRKRDHRILSKRTIGCLIEQTASQFKPKSGSVVTKLGASLLGDGSPELIKRVQVLTKYYYSYTYNNIYIHGCVATDYVNHLPDLLGPITQEVGENRRLASDEFLAEQASELGVTTERLVEAIKEWSRSAEDLYQKGLAALYEQRYEDASQLISESIGSGSETMLERHVPLARAEYEQGLYAASATSLRRVLAVHPDDPLLKQDLRIVLETQAATPQPQPLFSPTIPATISNKTFGQEHPGETIRLYYKAKDYIHFGEYLEAERLLQQIIATDEKILYPNHLEVAKDLNNLAALYVAQGRYADAEPLLKRCMLIDEDVLGKYREVRVDLRNLALVSEAQSKYKEAESFLKRALMIDGDLGQKLEAGKELASLAELYQLQGLDYEAEDYYKRALETEKESGVVSLKHFPEMSTQFTKERKNLAALYYSQGRYREAKPLLEAVLAADEHAAIGAEGRDVAPDVRIDHTFDVVRDLNNLAALSYLQGNYADAEPLYARAIEVAELAYNPLSKFHARQPELDVEIATLEENLALSLRRLGRDVEAKRHESMAAYIRAQGRKW